MRGLVIQKHLAFIQFSSLNDIDFPFENLIGKYITNKTSHATAP